MFNLSLTQRLLLAAIAAALIGALTMLVTQA